LDFQITSLVSFKAGSRGYVRSPKLVALDNLIELILRFKTTQSNGLLVYGKDGSVFSLRIKSGILVFESGGIRVSSTQSTRYDDDQWHDVFVAHTNQELLLRVDDFDNFQYVSLFLRYSKI